MDAAALAAEGTSPPAAAGKAALLGEVTIRGQRDLARGVTRFVDQIAVLENGEGMPRWNERVCPQVSGVSRRDGESILRRLSQIALEAEVPLDAETCEPNLYVVVVPDPRKALEKMSGRQKAILFGRTNGHIADDFIAMPRPVRVWYGSVMTDPFGIVPAVSLPCVGSATCDEPYITYADPTLLSYNHIWNFSRVVVVVEKARLRTLSVGQLADYVAMVGLARIRPDAHLEGAPTILKLFQSDAGSAPESLTDWDRGFLKSLYATEQRSKGQRGQIADGILQDLAHR
jgi:hypothetical protein